MRRSHFYAGIGMLAMGIVVSILSRQVYAECNFNLLSNVTTEHCSTDWILFGELVTGFLGPRFWHFQEHFWSSLGY
ncbi:MAG: hypothetical protein JRN20_18090 [Nitrososphaerota archaeon]|nr:hypothetical protein [Nitrososphaerota archaeon]